MTWIIGRPLDTLVSVLHDPELSSVEWIEVNLEPFFAGKRIDAKYNHNILNLTSKQQRDKCCKTGNLKIT